MRTVTWPPAAGTSMVPPGEAEYAHAPSWVTGKVELPIGHETVIVPVRGVAEGFASTRYWSADGIPYDGLGGFRIVIQSAFDVGCQSHPVPVYWMVNCSVSPRGSTLLSCVGDQT